MEEEEESHTAVGEATAIATDEVEAEDTTNLERAAQLREYCAMLSAPACSTTVKIRQQTKQNHPERNLCNTLA